MTPAMPDATYSQSRLPEPAGSVVVDLSDTKRSVGARCPACHTKPGLAFTFHSTSGDVRHCPISPASPFQIPPHLASAMTRLPDLPALCCSKPGPTSPCLPRLWLRAVRDLEMSRHDPPHLPCDVVCFPELPVGSHLSATASPLDAPLARLTKCCDDCQVPPFQSFPGSFRNCQSGPDQNAPRHESPIHVLSNLPRPSLRCAAQPRTP